MCIKLNIGDAKLDEIVEAIKENKNRKSGSTSAFCYLKDLVLAFRVICIFPFDVRFLI